MLELNSTGHQPSRCRTGNTRLNLSPKLLFKTGLTNPAPEGHVPKEFISKTTAWTFTVTLKTLISQVQVCLIMHKIDGARFYMIALRSLII